MHDPSKTKMAGFATVSEKEILGIQEDAVLEDTSKASKFGLKVLKGWKRFTDVELSGSFSGLALCNHRFHRSKQTRPPNCFLPRIGRNCAYLWTDKESKSINRQRKNLTHFQLS